MSTSLLFPDFSFGPTTKLKGQEKTEKTEKTTDVELDNYLCWDLWMIALNVLVFQKMSKAFTYHENLIGKSCVTCF